MGMKLSAVIKELQQLEKEHGGDIQVNAYLYKDWSAVRFIGVQKVKTIELGLPVEIVEVFIEGNKFHDL